MSTRLENQPGYVPISYAVNQALLENNDFSERNRDRFTSFAIKAYRDLNLKVVNSVRVAYLTMDDMNNVKLPVDYIRYVKVGINVGGRIWNLGVDDSILLGRGFDSGQDAGVLFGTSAIPSVGFGYYYTPHYYNGQYVDKLFGVGGGFRASYFRVDDERRMLTFDSPVPRSEVIVEYKSDGISAQTLIPKQCINAIEEYIHWRNAKGPERDRRKRDYDEAEASLRSFENAFNIAEFLDAQYSTLSQVKS